MFLKRWKSLWNPEMFQGWGKKQPYFEGWYYKIVDKNEQNAMAIIPAITIDARGSQPFVQVMDGKNCLAFNYKFEANQFWSANDRFKVKIGDNEFSGNKLKVDFPNLKADLEFKETTAFPKHLMAPGVMGWYSFVPFMECYHGVVSVHHQVEGKVKWRGDIIDYSGGKGYIEKDWGRSFPNSWIWAQSNHFDQEDVSFMISIAKIPWLGSSFIGFLGFLKIKNRVHRFATYTGARIKHTSVDNINKVVTIELKSRKHVLNILVEGDQNSFSELIAPADGMMTAKVNESLKAKVNIEFKEKGNLIFKGEGRNSGFEIGGEYKELLVN
ncbi:MAG: tocopherol cyclase family protein [Bacteroidota bacterium]